MINFMVITCVWYILSVLVLHSKRVTRYVLENDIQKNLLEKKL